MERSAQVAQFVAERGWRSVEWLDQLYEVIAELPQTMAEAEKIGLDPVAVAKAIHRDLAKDPVAGLVVASFRLDDAA